MELDRVVPFSPLLFALSVEPLAQIIRTSQEHSGIKIKKQCFVLICLQTILWGFPHKFTTFLGPDFEKIQDYIRAAN